jgi:hypothetical protein
LTPAGDASPYHVTYLLKTQQVNKWEELAQKIKIAPRWSAAGVEKAVILTSIQKKP